MKKISTIFLILFTLLTFSNTVSAGFFGDIFEELFGGSGESGESETWFVKERHGDANNTRCKVEYTQLDLATGLEKNVKHTAQYENGYVANGDNIMDLSAKDLTDKMNIWLNESPNNIITNMTIINCKERKTYASMIGIINIEYRWGEYKGCADEYNVKLIDWLERPNQRGYNVNIDRLIKDYEDGCENYIGTGR
jgi:hypothetical protein